MAGEQQTQTYSELYINRELSWVSFNERVLTRASQVRFPVSEKLTAALQEMVSAIQS